MCYRRSAGFMAGRWFTGDPLALPAGGFLLERRRCAAPTSITHRKSSESKGLGLDGSVRSYVSRTKWPARKGSVVESGTNDRSQRARKKIGTRNRRETMVLERTSENDRLGIVFVFFLFWVP